MAPEPGPLPQNSVSKTIDQHGGDLALGNEAWVNIPPGALDGALKITITKLASPPNPPANYVSRGAGYSFTPHKQIFNVPVTIGIIYETDAALSDPSMVRLDDDADNSWASVDSAVCAEGIATCTSSTFSILSVTSFQPLQEVYVSSSSQGPNAAGTRDDPLPTISAGIAAAQAAAQPFPPVKVAAGIYEETLEFAEGVSIEGGLDEETWESSADPTSYSIVDLGRSAAIATGITDSTHITGLVLRAASARVGAPADSVNSVALRLVNCREGLLFENCRFLAGDGAAPSQADSGDAGADGGDGKPAGNNGGTIYNGHHMEGGPGGTINGGYNGGKGGNAVYVGWGYQGGHGQGNKVSVCGGGCGGLGAWAPPLAVGSFVGGYGPSGTNGLNGAGGTNAGVEMETGWRPTRAGNGTGGEDGCGGGGGGGGLLLITGGMGGGGGGAGGTGGGGALGGRGGGSSFAVYLWESSPVFVNCEFVAGAGGHGGKGGDGGNRGEGGKGGVSYGSTNLWIIGGNGGAGGNGGFGGSGGGGAGGHSYCVYRVGTECENADFSACNIWDWHSGAYGRGGSGGQASNGLNAEGIQADPGANGTSGFIGPE